MRILRYLLIGLGAVLLLAVVAVGVFLATFDANTYKPRIQAAARDATGRELTLAGPISLKPSLRPTLTVADASLANAAWGSRPEMVRIGTLEVSLEVLPLIRGEVVIDRVTLVEPDILLETSKEGRGNWEFVPAQAAGGPAPPPPPGQPAPAGQPSGIRPIVVDLLTIERGTVAFRDGATGETITLAIPKAEAALPRGENMRLDLDAVLDGKPFKVTGTAGRLAALLDPAATTPFPLDLAVALDEARVTAKGTIAQPLQGKGYDLAVTAQVPDLARLGAAVPGAPPLPPLRGLEAAVSARDAGGPIPELRAITLKLAESDLSAFAPGVRVRRLEITAPDTTSPIRLAGEAVVNDTPATVAGTLGPLAALIPGEGRQAPWPVDVTMAAAGAQAAIKGAVANIQSQPSVDVALDLRVPDLAALSRLAGTALPPLKGIALTGKVTGPGQRGQVSIADLALKAGGSDLGGSVAVTPAPRLRVEARLRGQLVDADALMAALDGGAAGGTATPPASPPAPPAPAPQAGQQRLIPDQPLPLDALRGADAAVQLQLAELRLRGTAYKQVAGTLALDRGNLRLDPLNATIPGGAVTLRLAVDASKPEPPVRIGLSGPSVDLAALAAAYGGGYRVGGKLELDMDLRGTGATPARIASTLDGHLGVAGANLDIDNRLIDLVAGEVWRAMVPGAPREGVSNVRCLALRLDAASGVATANALLFDSNLAKVSGTGSVNLGPETLALRLMPTLKIGGGIGIPVNVGGTFLRPAIRPDASGVLGALGQRAAGGSQGGNGSNPLGAIVGRLGGGGGSSGTATGGTTTDDCAAQLAVARGGRQGATPAAPAQPAQQPAGTPAQQPAEPAPATQAPAQQQPQRPANPLQQLLPRLGR